MIPCIPCTGKYVHQVGLVTAFNCAAQLTEVAHNPVENTEHRLAVGQGNIPPHNRVTGSDTGKVAEATSGVAEDLPVLTHTGQCVHQRVGKKMG